MLYISYQECLSNLDPLIIYLRLPGWAGGKKALVPVTHVHRPYDTTTGGERFIVVLHEQFALSVWRTVHIASCCVAR